MAKAGPDLLVIDKFYDLVIWSCHRIAKFPRSHRFTLGDRLEIRLYRVLEMLLRAKYSRERAPILAKGRDGRAECESRSPSGVGRFSEAGGPNDRTVPGGLVGNRRRPRGTTSNGWAGGDL